MTVLVGGVGQLYQGDHDLGRVAVERLAKQDLGADVVVEDFHYGAIAVAQRLEDVRPDALLLVGAAERGRAPGTLERRRIGDEARSPDELRRAVESSVTGYVSIDLVIDVARAFGALPARTVAFEVEPVLLEPSETLSAAAAARLEEALALVRAEIDRLPALALADRLRDLRAGEPREPTAATRALDDLLGELARIDREGGHGDVFALRDRLKREIRAGHTGEDMGALDWGLWWALIEELDRLQPPEERIAADSSPDGGSSSRPRF